MAAGPPIRTVMHMTTTFGQTIPLPLDRVERSRVHHPARRPARWARGDAKLEMLHSIDSLAGATRADVVALAAVADIVRIDVGAVLEQGWRLGQQWWMPVDGWLLAEGDGTVARTVPAGHSWVAPRLPSARGRLTALRAGSVLVARVPTLASALADHPRLGEIVRATLVAGDV
jgi:hypothetical protein